MQPVGKSAGCSHLTLYFLFPTDVNLLQKAATFLKKFID